MPRAIQNKNEILIHANTYGNAKAAKKFGVSVSSIAKWKKAPAKPKGKIVTTTRKYNLRIKELEHHLKETQEHRDELYKALNTHREDIIQLQINLKQEKYEKKYALKTAQFLLDTLYTINKAMTND